MAQLTPLEQVQEDARRLTLDRIEAEKKAIAWQEAQEGVVSLDESVEAAKEVEKPKAVKTKKDK
jgi:hypothetical protein